MNVNAYAYQIFRIVHQILLIIIEIEIIFFVGRWCWKVM